MDFYAIIPHNHGVALRQLVKICDQNNANERDDPFDELKRAPSPPMILTPTSSASLPSNSSSSYDDSIFDIPSPEEELQHYQPGRLQKGLYQLSTRQNDAHLTPYLSHYLSHLRDAYSIALKRQGKCEAANAVVQKMELVYHSNAYLYPLTNAWDKRKEFEDKYAKKVLFHPVKKIGNLKREVAICLALKKWALRENYGDFLAPDTAQKIEGRVTQLSDRRDEDVERDMFPTQGLETICNGALSWDDICSVHDHFKDICMLTGLSNTPTSNVLIAELYHHHQTCSKLINKYIHEGWFTDLARRLHQDMKELMMVVADEEEARKYWCAMDTLKDRFFEVGQGWEDRPERWRRKVAAEEVVGRVYARRQSRGRDEEANYGGFFRGLSPGERMERMMEGRLEGRITMGLLGADGRPTRA